MDASTTSWHQPPGPCPTPSHPHGCAHVHPRAPPSSQRVAPRGLAAQGAPPGHTSAQSQGEQGMPGRWDGASWLAALPSIGTAAPGLTGAHAVLQNKPGGYTSGPTPPPLPGQVSVKGVPSGTHRSLHRESRRSLTFGTTRPTALPVHGTRLLPTRRRCGRREDWPPGRPRVTGSRSPAPRPPLPGVTSPWGPAAALLPWDFSPKDRWHRAKPRSPPDQPPEASGPRPR